MAETKGEVGRNTLNVIVHEWLYIFLKLLLYGYQIIFNKDTLLKLNKTHQYSSAGRVGLNVFFRLLPFWVQNNYKDFVDALDVGMVSPMDGALCN